MELDYEMLIKKVLDFWNKYDNKVIVKKDLTSFFSSTELITIFCDVEFARSYVFSAGLFKDKILAELYSSNKDDNNSLFKVEDIKNIINISEDIDVDLSYVFDFSSDEVLLSLLEDENYEDYYYDIIYSLRSDESRIKAYDLCKSERFYIIKNFESDELKLKYISKVQRRQRKEILAALNSDELKLKRLNFFTQDKALLISSLNSDELKIKLLNEYKLSDKDKAKIVSSLKDENLILKHIGLLDEKTKISMLNDEYSKEFLNVVLSSIEVNDENYFRIFENIVSFDDNLAINFFKKLNPIQREEALSKDIYINPVLLFKLYGYLEDKTLLYDYIDLGEPLPKYIDEYKYLVNNYGFDNNSTHSMEDKERFRYHLLEFFKEFSLDIIRYLDNKNVIEFLYSDDVVFYKILNLFKGEKATLDESSLNNILSAYLQRLFRNNNINLLSLNNYMLNSVLSNDLKTFNSYLDEISKRIDISINRDDFIKSLKNMDQKSIDYLRNLTNDYITLLRNDFVNDNYELFLDKVVSRPFNKKALMKYMIKNYPCELLLKYFDGKCINISNVSFSDKELSLLNNKELLKRIIEFRKNPKLYIEEGSNKPPLDISKNIGVFDNLFEKIVVRIDSSYFKDIDVEKDKRINNDVDSQIVCEILKNLNTSVLKLDLFSKSGLFEKLSNFFNEYKIGGWNREIYDLFESVGINVNPGIIAGLIECFGIISEKKDLTIIKALEESYCRNSVSNKYSILLEEVNFNLLVSDPRPNQSFKMTIDEKINTACEYLKVIRRRKYVTVPSMDCDLELNSGKKINVVVGNFSDPINLTYGERGLTCFRFGSHADSFLRYTLEDDNGFNIRFTDPKTGILVGRVTGFRNGNSVFLNVLYSNSNEYSMNELLNATKMVADTFIESTKDSLLSIDNVFLLDDFGNSNYKYVSTKKLLKTHFLPKRVYSDYDKRDNAIILATNEEEKDYKPIEINKEDVPRYGVVRDKIKTFNGLKAVQRVEELMLLDEYLSDKNLEDINIEKDDTVTFCVSGEDWCLYVNQKNELKSFVMNNSNNKIKALEEMKSCVGLFGDLFSPTMNLDDIVL